MDVWVRKPRRCSEESLRGFARRRWGYHWSAESETHARGLGSMACCRVSHAVNTCCIMFWPSFELPAPIVQALARNVVAICGFAADGFARTLAEPQSKDPACEASRGPLPRGRLPFHNFAQGCRQQKVSLGSPAYAPHRSWEGDKRSPFNVKMRRRTSLRRGVVFSTTPFTRWSKAQS